MSLGYADRLSNKDVGGQLGSPEIFDSEAALSSKAEQLAIMIREAKRVVVFTGAGISTACGIPDFRGPNGVWTLKRAGKPIPKLEVTLEAAKPTYTHQAISTLVAEGKVTYVVSQNIDNLHLRSGIPRQKLAELHGDCFAERCPRCKHEYIRDFEVETVGFQETGRICCQKGCKGKLRDHVLDWEDALPPDELGESERQASAAELSICLGTSLQISPANGIPIRTVNAGGKLVIVNLQSTPKDKKATLLIRGRSDEVMRQVMQRLRYSIPDYVRSHSLLVTLTQRDQKHGSTGVSCVATVTLSNVCGREWPSLIASKVSLTLHEGEFWEGFEGFETTGEPFQKERRVQLPCSLRLVWDVTFSETVDADKRNSHFEDVFELKPSGRLRSTSRPLEKLHTFVTQVKEYDTAEPENVKRQKTEEI